MIDGMSEKQESVRSALQAIRELMNSSEDKSEDDILELTEDDLFDEQDEDSYSDCRISKEEEKLRDINEILTQISHSVSKSKAHIEPLRDNSVTAENAAKSIAAIKNLIKKAELPEVKVSKFSNDVALEAMTVEILEPILKNWINAYLPTMVEQIIEKEVKRLIFEKDKSR